MGKTHLPRMQPGTIAGWSLSAQQRGLFWLEGLTARMSRGKKPAHLLVGERGEVEALFFLRKQGYVVVARRWRAADLRGDLDLVAWEGDTLCFIEVKARSARGQTPAALAIDQGKRRMLARMARAYLRTLPRPKVSGVQEQVLTRVDIVSVYLLPEGAECELIRDAFAWRGDLQEQIGSSRGLR